MDNVIVGRYNDPKAVGWQGWIEPKDKSWVMFVDFDGKPIVFLNRDPITGAIIEK